MPDIKNVSIIEEDHEEFAPYTPNDKETEVVESIFNKFRQSADDRNRSFEYFDGSTLKEYIDDSVRRFVTNVDERDDIEDWQARVHDPFTRNKVLAILGKIVSVLPIAQLKSLGEDDPRKGLLLSTLYEHSEEIDDYEELMVHILLDSIIKGMAIGYEGHERRTKPIRDVKGSGDNIKVTKTKFEINKLFGGIVALEDFYPSSVGIRTIKRMPYCFWRKTMTHTSFREDWASFDRAVLVQPNETQSADDESRPFYLDYISSGVQDGEVELIRYYNKDVDEYIIIANGIWLNPIKVKGNKFEISPLPFNHKELPFWEIKFDFFGSDFFYGKSLPDRLKSMQDVLNVLTNMLLDQSFMTIFPPLLTAGFDPIEDDYLRPGRRTPVETQGLPLKDQYLKLDLGTPSGWHQFILEYTRKIMEESSVDQVTQGIAGVGERTTAEEIRTAASGVASLLGLFARLVNYGIKRKALLRGKNILQFWTDPKHPIMKNILGADAVKDLNKAFNSFDIENGILTNGKRGLKIIEIFSNKKQLPTKKQLKTRASIIELETGKPTEVVSVTGDYIRNMNFDVKLIANPKSPTSQELEKALQLEKVRVYLSFFPEEIDRAELAAQTAEKMGDDPTKILKASVFGVSPEKATRGELDKGVGISPQGNIANNAARGARGGETSANQLKGLSQEITA